MNLYIIFLLTAITFLSRYLFLEPKLPLKIGPKFENFLSFSASSVLTSIWVPMIFIKEGEIDFTLTNPYLIGAIVAIFVSYKTKNIYLTLFISLPIFIFMFIG